MGDTAISWCDKVWNFLRGCTPVGEECAECYAKDAAVSVNRRFAGAGRPQPYAGLVELRGSPPRAQWTRKAVLVPEHLEDPLSWRAAQRVFVASMSDPYHEDVQRGWLDHAWAVTSLAGMFGGVHTYQWLTKRAEAQRDYLLDPDVWARVEVAARNIYKRRTGKQIAGKLLVGPLPNSWIGVSCGNVDDGKPRIDVLRETPAAVRWLSCEPLLEDLGELDLRGIDWVIAGCESGPRARACQVDWLRSIRDQCKAAGVAFFLKQAVREDVPRQMFQPSGSPYRDGRGDPVIEQVRIVRLGDGSRMKKGGVIELPYLDGEQHAAFPRSAV